MDQEIVIRGISMKIKGKKLGIVAVSFGRNSKSENCRTQMQPIGTIGEISAHIKILTAHQPYLYQKLSKKATQLRLLGMTYGEIAESLLTNRKTATKACYYQGM